jgi:hypothetical protein
MQNLSDEPRRVLVEIVRQRGQEILDEPRRLEGLLRDYCPARRREIVALVAAHKEHGFKDLMTLKKQIPAQVLISRLTSQLQDHVGLTADLAYWAVESWALALGIVSQPTSTDSNLLGDRTSGASLPAATELTTVLEGLAGKSTEVSSRPVTADTNRNWVLCATCGAKSSISSSRCQGCGGNLAGDEHHRRALEQAHQTLNRALIANSPEESLRLAEEARQLAEGALTSLPEPLIARDLVTQAESCLLRTARLCAYRARVARKLGAATAYFQRVLELSPADADARLQLQSLVAHREQQIDEAEKRWKDCKPKKAIVLLERAAALYPNDLAIREQIDRWKRLASRVDHVLNHEIPLLKAQKRLQAILHILQELEQVGAPVKGICEYRSAIELRFRACEPAITAAQSALGSREYLTAIGHCDQVLASIVDFERAQQIRAQAVGSLDVDQSYAMKIQATMQSGQWGTAARMLNQLAPTTYEQPAFRNLRSQIVAATARITGYWRCFGAAFGGVWLWMLAGWLGGLASQGLASTWSQYLGQQVLFDAISTSINCWLQLLFAAFLLGFGGAMFAGRSSLKSIPWNCFISTAGAVLVAGTMILAENAHTLRLPSIKVFHSMYALSAGLLLGIWLRHIPGIRHTSPVVTALTAMLATAAASWLSTLTLSHQVLVCSSTALNLCASLAVLGLVSRYWQFAMIPIGVLLSCGLATHFDSLTIRPSLIAVTIGVTLAISVLALTLLHVGWYSVTGTIVVGILIASFTQLSLRFETTPPVALLMTVWSSVILVQSLRNASLFQVGLLPAGLRYLVDSLLISSTQLDIPQPELPEASQ